MNFEAKPVPTRFIPIKRGIIRLYALGSLMFAFIGIGMVLWSLNEKAQIDNARFLIGVLTIGFFGLCFAILLRTGFRRNAGIEIGPESFTVRLLPKKPLVVRWEHVEGFDIFTSGGQPFVRVLLTDPDLYIPNGFVWALIAKLNKTLFQSPILIPLAYFGSTVKAELALGLDMYRMRTQGTQS